MTRYVTPSKWPAAFARFVVAGFAGIALVAAQLVLSAAIHRTNYSGGDGKLAQATILTAYKFANFLHFNNINPMEGLGSQLLPMNVWINPAYWPFAFLPKELATDVSAAIALGIFVIADYVTARCFDVPVVPSQAARHPRGGNGTDLALRPIRIETVNDVFAGGSLPRVDAVIADDERQGNLRTIGQSRSPRRRHLDNDRRRSGVQ
jgi:hypothetical protein